MIMRLIRISDFARKFRMRARFGDLSRAPLTLLRVELRGDYAECDWIARPIDQWDADLKPNVGKRNASTQALRDALRVRDFMFWSFPDLHMASVRVYRRSTGGPLGLIIAGTIKRHDQVPAGVRSLPMRGKLLGLQFSLEDGILSNMQTEESVVEEMILGIANQA
jgi:hypothetical protein